MYIHAYLFHDLCMTGQLEKIEDREDSDSWLQNCLWCHVTVVSKGRLSVTQGWMFTLRTLHKTNGALFLEWKFG